MSDKHRQLPPDICYTGKGHALGTRYRTSANEAHTKSKQRCGEGRLNGEEESRPARALASAEPGIGGVVG